MLEFSYIISLVLSTQVLHSDLFIPANALVESPSGADCKASYAFKRLYSTHFNVKLSGKNFIKSFTARDHKDCENECFFTEKDNCYKYNYNYVSRLCGMMNRGGPGSNTIWQSTDSVVGIRKCASRDCYKASQCFLLGNAITQCLCPPPLNITNCTDDGWLKVSNDPVCFGAKSNSYGKISIPYDGILTGLKLKHVSGGVKSTTTQPTGYWGTGGTEAGKIETILTDYENKTLSPPEDYAFHLSNKTYSLKDYTNLSPEIELPGLEVKVKDGRELRVWIIEDLINVDESDNSGATCADVYLMYNH